MDTYFIYIDFLQDIKSLIENNDFKLNRNFNPDLSKEFILDILHNSINIINQEAGWKYGLDLIQYNSIIISILLYYIDNNNEYHPFNNQNRNIFQAYKILDNFIQKYEVKSNLNHKLNTNTIINMIHFADFSKYKYYNKNLYFDDNKITHSNDIDTRKKLIKYKKEYTKIKKWQLIPRYIINLFKLKKLIETQDLANVISYNLLNSETPIPLYSKNTPKANDIKFLINLFNNKYNNYLIDNNIMNIIYYDYLYLYQNTKCDIDMINTMLDNLIKPIFNICFAFNDFNYITYEMIILELDNKSKKIILDALIKSGNFNKNYINHFILKNNIILDS